MGPTPSKALSATAASTIPFCAISFWSPFPNIKPATYRSLVLCQAYRLIFMRTLLHLHIIHEQLWLGEVKERPRVPQGILPRASAEFPAHTPIHHVSIAHSLAYSCLGRKHTLLSLRQEIKMGVEDILLQSLLGQVFYQTPGYLALMSPRSQRLKNNVRLKCIYLLPFIHSFIHSLNKDLLSTAMYWLAYEVLGSSSNLTNNIPVFMELPF